MGPERSVGVALEGIGKRYGSAWAVRDISLSVGAGEFLSIVGPSGCGKTTLLRLVAGFVRPDEGTVRLGEQPVNDVPVRERRVGLVFQNYALFPNMTLYENVAFGLKAQNRSATEVRRRTSDLLEMVGMADRAQSYPRQLSGGQQQRIALARALAVEPRVLLLDEPLSALDAKVRNSLRFEIKRIQRDSGITMIYVTHDQEEALSISDRVALMRKGALEQVGTPIELYSDPCSLFAADFIGVSNLLKGESDGEGGFLWKGHRFILETPVERGPASLMIRPERLFLAPEGVAGANVIEALVQGRVFLGPITRFSCNVEGEPLLLDLLNVAGAGLKVGERVRLHFEPSDSCVLQDLKETVPEGVN
ncbi:MAG: ABC transporter ATP-binding protein [Fretibacterium sp.]|nr:ABC transporter ATP-binding protein [Fretibacterium sp.]